MRQVKFCPRFGDDREAPCKTIEERDGERVERRCMFLTKLRGVDPQSGEPVDREMCMDEARLLTHLDQNKHINEMSSSIQALRNEVDEQRQEAARLRKAFNRIPVKQEPAYPDNRTGGPGRLIQNDNS